jgi:ATP-dependent DNA helicase DinG
MTWRSCLGRSALLDAAFERATLYRARLKRLKEINQPGFSYWYECTSRHFTRADAAHCGG